MKPTIIICIISLFITITTTTKNSDSRYKLNRPQCSADEQKKIDLIIAKAISIGPYGRKFPETMDQLKKYCRDTTTMIEKVEQYFQQCYTKELRNYSNIFIYTVKRNLRRYCYTKSGHKVIRDFLVVAKCANKHIQPNSLCLTKYIDHTKQLVNVVLPDRTKLAHMCCNFVNVVQCSENRMNSIDCIRDKKQIFMDFLRSGTSRETLCGDYTEATDACGKLGKQPSPVVENKRHYYTPVFMLIDLLESMKNFTAFR